MIVAGEVDAEDGVEVGLMPWDVAAKFDDDVWEFMQEQDLIFNLSFVVSSINYNIIMAETDT